jgi:hypothetical protein
MLVYLTAEKMLGKALNPQTLLALSNGYWQTSVQL